ncbi:MAG: hypothetical protein IH859_10020 [Chloroflexi bacterium]|nr:hypothetical protein [Chloroflexota bacterium]
MAIDSAALLIICTSINYARLVNKWYGASGADWYTPYLVGAMAIGGFLAVLPFKGLELGIFGIILLGVSVIYLSNKVVTKTCSIKQ